jgi:hypothetical protein
MLIINLFELGRNFFKSLKDCGVEVAGNGSSVEQVIHTYGQFVLTEYPG